jgi:hypothetical protein
MACPLFLPISPLAGLAPEAAPLGDFYGGQCAADPGTLIPLDTLHRCCNTGYARKACPYAAQTEADAVRFLIKADQGGVLDIAWSLERNHHPVAVGTAQVKADVPPDGSPLDRQVRAYAAAYFRQTGKERNGRTPRQ